MADYFTQFCCLFDVGSAEKAVSAEAIRDELEAALDRDEEAELGFRLLRDQKAGAGIFWIASEDSGEPEHVIRFVLICAERLNLSGIWGFSWSHYCSKMRADGFGGGAHVLGLGKRVTVADIDCASVVAEHMRPEAAEGQREAAS
jgi:hypothetical protein